MQRIMWIKCLVQSNVFQGGVVSDILYYFLILSTRLKKEEHGDSLSSQRRGDCQESNCRHVLDPAFLGDVTYIPLLNNRARVVFSPLNSQPTATLIHLYLSAQYLGAVDLGRVCSSSCKGSDLHLLLVGSICQTPAHELGLGRVGACFSGKSQLLKAKKSWGQEGPECLSLWKCTEPGGGSLYSDSSFQDLFPFSSPPTLRPHLYCPAARYEQEKSRKSERTEIALRLEARNQDSSLPLSQLRDFLLRE